MSRTPIEILFDRVEMRCTRCNALRSEKCTCWEQVKLHCPSCGATKKATREPSDPKGAKVIELKCPKCWEKVA